MDKIKIIKIIREISLFIFVLTTIFPEFSSKIIAIPSILIWLLMNLLIDRKKFFEFFIKPNLMMYSIYFWILTNMIYIITGYSPDLKLYLTNYIRIALTSIIYLYYAKTEEKTSMKKIVIYSIIIIMIVNIITIIANLRHYNISRLLSTPETLNINTFGVGSYFYIYGLIYPIMILIAYLIRNIKKIQESNYIITTEIILCIIISIYTIYITEFLIAIALLFFGLLLIILKIDNAKKFIKYVFIMIITVIILSPLLSFTFKTIAEKTDSHNYKIRAEDMHTFFSTGNIDNTVDLKERVEVYAKSIESFVSHPLLGTEGTKDTDVSIGKHSTILDQLGKYGLIGSIPFLFFIYALYKETFKTFNNPWSKRIYINCLIVFSIFIIINTSLFVSIFYMVFAMSPMMLKIFDEYELVKNESKGEANDENTLDC